MLLEGSCRCGAVRFRVESPEPYPFMRCYCSICRKTAGGGGYAVNLGALSGTLEVEGEDNLSVYNAKPYDRGDAGEVPASEAERNFCRLCGSFLWLFSTSYPELVHPSPPRWTSRSRSPRSATTSCSITPRHGVRSPLVRPSAASQSTRTNRSPTGTAATAYVTIQLTVSVPASGVHLPPQRAACTGQGDARMDMTR